MISSKINEKEKFESIIFKFLFLFTEINIINSLYKIHSGKKFYPKDTSRIIIKTNPIIKANVAKSVLSPDCDDGIKSSTTI